MRSWVVALLVAAVMGMGCSRHDAKPSPPTPKESSSATTLSAALQAPANDPATAAPSSQPRSLAGTKVLHVGDSMVGGTLGLTQAFEAKLTAEGATIVRHTKVSESLLSFDKSPTLKDLLRTHDPDIVVITLGANDASVPYPQAYARSVENVTRRVGDRECWWIGPPSWKGPDTGIVSMIQEHVGACHFFDSSKLELERTSDGIHPNDRGATKWAEAFWQVFRNSPSR